MKSLLIVALILLFMPFTSAIEITLLQTEGYGINKIEDLKIICKDNGNYCDSSVVCSGLIVSPDSKTLTEGNFSRYDSYFNLSFTASKNGQYYLIANCVSPNNSTVMSQAFLVESSTPFIFYVLILGIFLLIASLILNDVWVAGFSGLIFIGLGLYILLNGLDFIKNSLVELTGLILIFFGSYTIIKASLNS